MMIPSLDLKFFKCWCHGVVLAFFKGRVVLPSVSLCAFLFIFFLLIQFCHMMKGGNSLKITTTSTFTHYDLRFTETCYSSSLLKVRSVTFPPSRHSHFVEGLQGFSDFLREIAFWVVRLNYQGHIFHVRKIRLAVRVSKFDSTTTSRCIHLVHVATWIDVAIGTFTA